MGTMKRIGAAGLLAAAVVLGMPGRVSANTIQLLPPPDGPFPKASGSVSKAAFGPIDDVYDEFSGSYYIIYAACQVKGLAPNTVYLFEGEYLLTDASGKGEAWVYLGESPKPGVKISGPFAVYDYATGVLVLTSD